MQQNNVSIETIAKDILEFGDLCIVSNKGMGKTNTLMVLANQFRRLPFCKVIIFETFPKWSHDFNTIPYVFINDNDVTETNLGYSLQDQTEAYSYFTKDRTYWIRNTHGIGKALFDNKDLLFTLDIEDTTRISYFLYAIFYQFYRRNYMTAYKYGTDAIKQHVIFIVEESQNLFDRTVVAKKIFNRLRKMYSESRNLKLHFVYATQRIVDISTRIRGRSRFLIGNVNIDDYDLKIRRILRHSQYKKQILGLNVGRFLYVSTDKLIQFPKFEQKGKPYEISVKTSLPQRHFEDAWKPKKLSLLEMLKNAIGI